MSSTTCAIVAFIRLLASLCAFSDPVNVLQKSCLSARLVELQYSEIGASFEGSKEVVRLEKLAQFD